MQIANYDLMQFFKNTFSFFQFLAKLFLLHVYNDSSDMDFRNRSSKTACRSNTATKGKWNCTISREYSWGKFFFPRGPVVPSRNIGWIMCLNILLNVEQGKENEIIVSKKACSVRYFSNRLCKGFSRNVWIEGRREVGGGVIFQYM